MLVLVSAYGFLTHHPHTKPLFYFFSPLQRRNISDASRVLSGLHNPEPGRNSRNCRNFPNIKFSPFLARHYGLWTGLQRFFRLPPNPRPSFYWSNVSGQARPFTPLINPASAKTKAPTSLCRSGGAREGQGELPRVFDSPALRRRGELGVSPRRAGAGASVRPSPARARGRGRGVGPARVPERAPRRA